jgi:hypothetical protein
VLGNIFWFALTNIKRKRLSSLIYFILAFIISQSLFLFFLSVEFFRLPAFSDIKNLFFTIILSILFFSVLASWVFSYLFLHTRRRELGILRICGIRKADVLMAVSLEICIVTFFGAIAGIICIMCSILFKIIYLPFFIENLTQSKLMLTGISGQTIFAVMLLEIFFSLVLISLLLRHDINRLVRGMS